MTLLEQEFYARIGLLELREKGHIEQLRELEKKVEFLMNKVVAVENFKKTNERNITNKELYEQTNQ